MVHPTNTGISAEQRQIIANGLITLLADTYTLYAKTHNFHWNVTGPMFNTLHLMFETEYNELWSATDVIAERIRALGFFVPATYKSSIKLPEEVPSAQEMIKQLLDGHEAVTRTVRSLFPHADDAHDEATADLLTARLNIHEKTAWMLRSLLEA